MITVFKFGGASVKDTDGVRNLRKIIDHYRDQQLLVVVSAMGKSTNNLQSIANKKMNDKNYHSELEEFFRFHEKICLELFNEIPEIVQALRLELIDLLQREVKDPQAFYDHILAFGELLSTRIVDQYIGGQWVDARDFIRTNEVFGEADVDWPMTMDLIGKELPDLLQASPVITQGFIGSDYSGHTTTLGREGSDYSAAIFAHCLGAQSMTVWKDVPGLLNADPKLFPQAELFDHISYQEVVEMTYYGAKVIHPKTIYPLAQKKIPLFVRSFIDFEGKGTEISEDKKLGTRACYVLKDNQLLVSVRVRDSSFMDENKLSFILQTMSHTRVKANLTHNSALTFTFCMDNQPEKRDKLIAVLSEHFQVLYNEGLFLATIKNYNEASFTLLPGNIEKIIEEKTRLNYQVVYKPK